jgi:hypothetical protein
MKQLLLIYILALFPSFALSADLGDMVGKLKNGDAILLRNVCPHDDLVCQKIPNHFVLYLVTKINQKTVQKHIVTTSCKFAFKKDKYQNDINDKFSCIKDKKSPLSGSVYKVKEYNGDCEKGDPSEVLTCMKNCKTAPKRIEIEHWEC